MEKYEISPEGLLSALEQEVEQAIGRHKLKVTPETSRYLTAMLAKFVIFDNKSRICQSGFFLQEWEINMSLEKQQSETKIEQKENKLELTIKNTDDKFDKALWGTNRQMVANLIIGVSQGYSKQLEINGVGYKAELKGNTLVLAVGYSHPINFKLPPNVTVNVEKNIITLQSINKQLLGETAASLRKIRKPEPYKGKGIKYIDEIIVRKAGKQVKTTAG